MKKLFVVLLVILGVILLIIGGVVIAATSPKDLGVRYTKADLDSVNKKIGVSYNPLATNSPSSLKIEGTQALNTQVTQSELTALLNQFSDQWKDYPVSNVQLKINPDGTVEMTGKILVKKFEAYSEATNMPKAYKDLIAENAKLVPVNPSFDYKGNYEIQNGKLVGEMTELKVGPIEVPKDWANGNKDFITGFIEDRLNSAGAKIDSASFKGGTLDIKGSVPETISFEK